MKDQTHPPTVPDPPTHVDGERHFCQSGNGRQVPFHATLTGGWEIHCRCLLASSQLQEERGLCAICVFKVVRMKWGKQKYPQNWNKFVLPPPKPPVDPGNRLKGGGGCIPLPPPHCTDSAPKAFPYPNTSPNRISNRQKPPPPTAFTSPVTALQPLWDCPNAPPPLQAKPCSNPLRTPPGWGPALS